MGCTESSTKDLPISPRAEELISAEEKLENNLIASSSETSPTINIDDFSGFEKQEINLKMINSGDEPSQLPSAGPKLMSQDSLLPPVSLKINPSTFGVSQAVFEELNFEAKRLGKVSYDAEAYRRLKAKGKITEKQMLEIMNTFQGHMYELTHPEKLSFWNPSSVEMESFNLSDYNNSGSATGSEEPPPNLDSILSNSSKTKSKEFGRLESDRFSGNLLLNPVVNDIQKNEDSRIPYKTVLIHE